MNPWRLSTSTNCKFVRELAGRPSPRARLCWVGRGTRNRERGSPVDGRRQHRHAPTPFEVGTGPFHRVVENSRRTTKPNRRAVPTIRGRANVHDLVGSHQLIARTPLVVPSRESAGSRRFGLGDADPGLDLGEGPPARARLRRAGQKSGLGPSATGRNGSHQCQRTGRSRLSPFLFLPVLRPECTIRPGRTGCQRRPGCFADCVASAHRGCEWHSEDGHRRAAIWSLGAKGRRRRCGSRAGGALPA